MEVGMVAWPLVQMGLVLPIAGQFPQYRPGTQSVAEEHDSSIWQFPLEQAEEREKKKESRRRRRETDTTLLKPLVHADIAP